MKNKNITLYLFDISNRNVGLGEFAYQLGLHISEKATLLREKYGVKFTFLVPKNFKGCFGESVEYKTFQSNLLYKFYYRHFYRADCFHLIHQFNRLKFVRSSHRSLMTVHDINFMYEKKGSRLDWYMRRFKKYLQDCTDVSYISNFVKSDVESVFSPLMDGCVIYNGVTDLSGIYGDFEKFNLKDEDYLFHISSLMPKKNAHFLVEMMRYLPNEKLVIVGNLNTAYAKDLEEKKKQWNLDNVIMLNHVGNEDKAELYRHCKAFLFPSLCEGFGLPPIEAMHFGKPVFLSTLTSLPEVGGECAYYYDDLSPEKMAKKTSVGLADFLINKEEKVAKLIERANSFSWEKCVDSYIALYLNILGISATKERRSEDIKSENMISVCIATYNGEKYIKEQLVSILNQIKEADEVIVSDDGSTDNTLEIIKSLNDNRIKIFEHSRSSGKFTIDYTTSNFENAIRHSKGDLIFLSDQDDVWKSNKVEVLSKLLGKYDVVMSDSEVVDSEMNVVEKSFFSKYRKFKKSILYNIYKPAFYGCCMAFKREVLEKVLPFPKYGVGHDLWIGLVSLKCYNFKFINQTLMYYRRHDRNITNGGIGERHTSLWFKIRYRWFILLSLVRLIQL